MNKVRRFAKWEKEEVPVMKNILRAKAEQIEEVKEELLNSGERLIAEDVVSDEFWGCGLGKEAAAKTDPEHWPGLNTLG